MCGRRPCENGPPQGVFYTFPNHHFSFLELDPGIASMSSEYSDKYSAAKCIDGDLDTYCHNQKGGDEKPFFMIEYKEPKKVYQVTLTIKPGKEKYAKGIQVFVSGI